MLLAVGMCGRSTILAVTGERIDGAASKARYLVVAAMLIPDIQKLF